MLLHLDLHPQWSGIGPDAGRDLLFEEPGFETLGAKQRTWVVFVYGQPRSRYRRR